MEQGKTLLHTFDSAMQIVPHEGGFNTLSYIFSQDIFRKSDGRLCFRATVELVCLINGRLGNSDDYDRAFAPYI